MWVNGVEVQPTDSFRVTMNNFLATGGDGFTVFNEGTDALGGAQDIDALRRLLRGLRRGGIAVPPLNRIVAKSAGVFLTLNAGGNASLKMNGPSKAASSDRGLLTPNV